MAGKGDRDRTDRAAYRRGWERTFGGDEKEVRFEKIPGTDGRGFYVVDGDVPADDSGALEVGE